MDATLNLRVIVLPEEREEIFDKIKQVVSQAVKENQLPCNWIQVCETPLKQRFFEANPGSHTRQLERSRRRAFTGLHTQTRRSSRAAGRLYTRWLSSATCRSQRLCLTSRLSRVP